MTHLYKLSPDNYVIVDDNLKGSYEGDTSTTIEMMTDLGIDSEDLRYTLLNMVASDNNYAAFKDNGKLNFVKKLGDDDMYQLERFNN